MTAREHVQRFRSMWRLPPLSESGWRDFWTGLENLVTTAQREASEEMRERAAKVCDDQAKACRTNEYRTKDGDAELSYSGAANSAEEVAAAIRALPLD